LKEKLKDHGLILQRFLTICIMSKLANHWSRYSCLILPKAGYK